MQYEGNTKYSTTVKNYIVKPLVLRNCVIKTIIIILYDGISLIRFLFSHPCDAKLT